MIMQSFVSGGLCVNERDTAGAGEVKTKSLLSWKGPSQQLYCHCTLSITPTIRSGWAVAGAVQQDALSPLVSVGAVDQFLHFLRTSASRSQFPWTQLINVSSSSYELICLKNPYEFTKFVIQ
jgi:hypothetical protein